MLVAIIASGLLVAIATVIHYEVLGSVNTLLPTLKIQRRAKLLVVIFSATAAHLVEIGLYGIALFVLAKYLSVGAFVGSPGFSLTTCLYFSAETYTSLGFGDLTPVGPIRLLAGVEALNGLVLIGWTASYTYIAMERFWSR
ncbi:MAG: ion channel [Burkholderiaceae bacterium]